MRWRSLSDEGHYERCHRACVGDRPGPQGPAEMRVALIGRTRMLLDTAELLLQAGHQITLVATCRSSERHTAKEADFERLARAIGAEFLQGQDLNRPEIVARLSGAGADVGVSVDWVNLIGPDACTAFPHGILNTHGGDLPRY